MLKECQKGKEVKQHKPQISEEKKGASFALLEVIFALEKAFPKQNPTSK